ncbi:hypothetical protein [Paracoccus sp. (in: a-proteobacteria)]|uniref:hypothetical protein n=1 Tax=Paracoccus sp. TaxID=267 RepID=UPI0026DF8154|nr:hypothetical protein [Paracoccus sp. (in: a-proteobacteria)]MDO5648921.1 hypothetical protein [Paracoccus sp. (in: a-proteobacteria)]
MQISITRGWSIQPHATADCRNADDWAALLDASGGGLISVSLHGEKFCLSVLRDTIGPRPSWPQVVNAVRAYSDAYLPQLRWGDAIDLHEVDGALPIAEHKPVAVSTLNIFSAKPNFIDRRAASAAGLEASFETIRYRGFYLLFERGRVVARSRSGINQGPGQMKRGDRINFHWLAHANLKPTYAVVASDHLPIHGCRVGRWLYRQADWEFWGELACAEIDRHHAGQAAKYRVDPYRAEELALFIDDKE